MLSVTKFCPFSNILSFPSVPFFPLSSKSRPLTAHCIPPNFSLPAVLLFLPIPPLPWYHFQNIIPCRSHPMCTYPFLLCENSSICSSQIYFLNKCSTYLAIFLRTCHFLSLEYSFSPISPIHANLPNENI